MLDDVIIMVIADLPQSGRVFSLANDTLSASGTLIACLLLLTPNMTFISVCARLKSFFYLAGYYAGRVLAIIKPSVRPSVCPVRQTRKL